MKIESNFYHFHSRKRVWKCCLQNGTHFVQGGDELSKIRTWISNHFQYFYIKYTLSVMPLLQWQLTLDVRGPSYLGLTRSISWLLLPWLLMSPGHQQPWYWLCRIGRFWSCLRKDFNYLRLINVEKWHKCKYMFMFPLKNLARKGLNQTAIEVRACHILYGSDYLSMS